MVTPNYNDYLCTTGVGKPNSYSSNSNASRSASRAGPNSTSTVSRGENNSKLGQKALMRKLMMKNAKTKLDRIVAKYNYSKK